MLGSGRLSTYLAFPPGDDNGWATGINDAGVVVGATSTGFGISHPTYWDLTNSATRIPGIVEGYASAVNNSGWMVGESWSPTFAGFRYKPGGPVQFLLDQQGATGSKAYGINESGVVVGEHNGPVVWTASGRELRITVPPRFGQQYGAAVGLNDAGELVGFFIDTTTFAYNAFVMRRGQAPQLLLAPPGRPETFAKRIDARGAVYGWAAPSGGQYLPYIWVDGVPIPVAPGGALSDISDVNECGTAVGTSLPLNVSHAIVWRPTSC